MKKNITILLMMAVVAVSGCSTIKTNELTHMEAQQLNDKSLAYTKYNRLQDFPAQTAVTVQFGLLGVSSAISSGNTMMRNNKITDPALDIAQALAKKLSDKHKVKVVQNEQVIPLNSDVKSIVSQYPGSDYILDVKTANWSSIYFPSDWNNYRIIYNGHARLIDTSSQTVIAEVLCTSNPEFKNTDLAPSYEALESGVGIRSELAKAIDFCVDYIISEANINGDKKVTNAIAGNDNG